MPRRGRWLAVAAIVMVLGAHLGVGATLINQWGFSVGVGIALLVAKLVAGVGVHATRRWRYHQHRAVKCADPARGHGRRRWRLGRGA
ncbi:hypothetical protein H7J87_00480 [Mycolicibacterium wolinskyi]|nr:MULTISPECIES: hypothetical protein [Mycolicibacterium]MCV7283806.1 hypothetical protein [Mycolicibacterium wolinskyi]MCV7297240.1 hypothetical protein [Mycolicibacterium goodii]